MWKYGKTCVDLTFLENCWKYVQVCVDNRPKAKVNAKQMSTIVFLRSWRRSGVQKPPQMRSKIDTNQWKGMSGGFMRKKYAFLTQHCPKRSQNGAKMELNLSQNWVKIEAKKKSQNLIIFPWFLMIFGDIFGWFLKPLIETAKMEKP